MLGIIIKDLCHEENPNTSTRIISNTLKNSLLSIINRYILLYPDYFFAFLINKLNMNYQTFYNYYFRNM